MRKVINLLEIYLVVAFIVIGFSVSFAEPQEIKPNIKPQRMEEMKKETQPRPKVGPIRISGYVTVPDGRGLGGITIKLYDSRGAYMGDVGTTIKKTGFYSIELGDKFFDKEVKLVPKHPAFREGEHFSPREDRFRITSDKMDNRNFRYNGPLPDLYFTIVPAVFYQHWYIENGGGLESGPFKAKFIFRKEEEPKRYVEKIRDFPSIPAHGRKELTPEVLPVPDGHFLSDVEVDIEDTVFESNENNNVYRRGWRER